MHYLSLFSGIEAASLAWKPLGWRAVAFAEIHPFAYEVLAQRFPGVPNLGDVTQITDAQIAALGPFDLVVGGSPCTDLSVAGRRAGLDGKQSRLFFEQMRIFHAARKHCGTRWLLWENVPGALYGHKGQDFARVVKTLAGIDTISVPQNGWGSEGAALGRNGLLQWRVLDAQFFGVPQQRRRIFALLDTGDWENTPPVLFEPESLRRNPAPDGKAREATA
jgi:DNA (cytosine-5)-methyltransferase 1